MSTRVPIESLTRTQQVALGHLRAHGPTWPAARGRYAGSNTTPWSQRTLQALVDQGFAEWRQREGVMPHVVPTFWEEQRFWPDNVSVADDLMCRDHRRGFTCTRIHRHVGPHLAGTQHKIVAGWMA